jgi:hypothetical protein
MALSQQPAPPADNAPRFIRRRVTSTPIAVSIIMPCLNESASVGTSVLKAERWLRDHGVQGEVIVVDNGSEDDSAAVAEAAGARVVFEARRGYGSALLRGITESAGEILVMGDCDETYDFSQLDSLIAPLRAGADISIGNRYAGGIEPGAMTWSHRYLGTPALSLLVKLSSGVRHGDSQCGLRAFTRSAIERLDLRCDGMEFASEMLLKAGRQKMTIAEVPIRYYPRVGETKLNTFRDGWRHLRFLLLATPHYLYTLPGAALLLLGALITALSLVSPDGVSIAGVHWQPVFAGAIFLLVGTNAFLFGVVSRLHTSSLGLTPDDGLASFYRRHFSFERMLLLGGLLFAAGGAIEVTLLFDRPGGGGFSPEAVSYANLAQTLIVVGASLCFSGALSSLIDVDRRA